MRSAAKLQLVLNAKLAEPWSAEAITVDMQVLAGAVEDWNVLDTASSAVKVNVLLALLCLRPVALKEAREHVDKIVELALEDHDEWVRITGMMVKPLVQETPQRVDLSSDREFAATVAQIQEMLVERGQPEFLPLEDAFLDPLALPQSQRTMTGQSGDVATTNAPTNPFFTVPEKERLIPLQPHPDPFVLIPKSELGSVTVGMDQHGGVVPRVGARPLGSAMDERKKHGTLRATSLLVEKKPYVAKKAVKAMPTEKLDEIAALEEKTLEGAAQAARNRNRGRVIRPPVTAPTVTGGAANAGAAADGESALKKLKPEGGEMAVLEGLTSFGTRMSGGASAVAPAPSSDNNAAALGGFAMLSDLSSQGGFSMLSDLQSQPSNRETPAPIMMQGMGLLSELTSAPVSQQQLQQVEPSPQELLGLLGDLTSTPAVVLKPEPVVSFVAPPVAAIVPTPEMAPFAQQEQQQQQQQQQLPAAPPAAAFDLATANRLNEADRTFIEQFMRDPQFTANPDPSGGTVFSIVMHEAVEGGFLVNYVFEANFETKTYKRIKRKRKM